MRGISTTPVNPQAVQQVQNQATAQGLQQGPTARSFGQRFVNLFRRGQQHGQPPQVQQAPLRPAFHHALNPRLENGKLALNHSLAGDTIEKVLNQPHKHYSHATADTGGVRFQVQQSNAPRGQREAVHIQQTAATVAVLKTSRPAQLAEAQRADGAAEFPPSPGRAHLALASGVYSNSQGQQFRLHEGRLHQFDAATHRWQPSADQNRYSRLIAGGDGHVHGLAEGTDDQCCVAGGQVTLANAGERSTVECCFYDMGEAEVHERLSLKHEDGQRDFMATRIGLTVDGANLYACNEQGELFCDHQEDGLGNITMRQLDLHPLELALDGRVRVEAFMLADDGSLNALVRDRHDQLHACPIDEHGRPSPGWNLSDALVLTKNEGLPRPLDPLASKQLDLGPRGKVTLHQGLLHSWDRTSQAWTASAQRVERLERGVDGQAYALQNGELKNVAVSTSGETLRVGASHDLTPTGRRTQISMGATLAGAADRQLRAFAVADGTHFVTLDQNNQMRAHIDGREVDLAFPANAGGISALALDHQQNLYAQDGNGAIHMLEKQQWQKVFAESNWIAQPTPGDQPAQAGSLRIGADMRPQAIFAGTEQRLGESGQGRSWQAMPSAAVGESAVPLAQRLEGHHRPGRFAGANVASSSHVLGQTTEGVSAKDRGFFKGVRAHFHPLQSIKESGQAIQHVVKGRVGLQDVYADETALLQRLPVLAHAAPRTDLQARIDGLALAPAQPLKTALEALRKSVESSSHRGAVRLGQLHGILGDQGIAKEDYRPSLRKRLINRASHSERRQVTKNLSEAFEKLASSANNPASRVLADYQARGLLLSHRSLGKLRDKSDRSALVKDQLIFDAHTLSELHSLVDQLEGLQAQPDSASGPAQLRGIAARFEQLKDSYQNSDLRVFTAANITSHGQLERLYGQRKQLASQLGGQQHALNLNTRRALGVSANDVNGALVDNIRRMDAGDSLSLARSDGTSLSTPTISVTGVEPFWFSGSAAREKTIGVSISRTSEGADLTLTGGASHSASAVVGAGAFFGLKGKPGAEFGLFAGAEVSGSIGHKRATDISFSLKEADLGRVMHNLTDRKAPLTELLKLGAEHKATESRTISADIDLWAGAEARANIGNSPSATTFMRSSLGPALNANLAHYERRSATSHGADGERASNSNSDGQLLRKADAGLYFRPVQGAYSTKTSDSTSLFNRVPLEVSAKISLDRTRQRSFTVSFKAAEPVEQSALDGLWASLQREFPAGLPVRGEGHSVTEQLQQLHNWQQQLPGGDRTDNQHEALRELSQLHHQQSAAAAGRRQFSSAECSLSSTSLSGKQQAWLQGTAPDNASSIRALLGSDPRFSALVKSLESGKGTDAKLLLELKDSVRKDIEARCAAGEDIDRPLRQALGERNNLRIKSISVKHTAAQSHGMATPPVILGFSSNASLSHTQTQGKIDFSYGHDEDRPVSYSLDGAIARQNATQDLLQAMSRAENVSVRFGSGNL